MLIIPYFEPCHWESPIKINQTRKCFLPTEIKISLEETERKCAFGSCYISHKKNNLLQAEFCSGRRRNCSSLICMIWYCSCWQMGHQTAACTFLFCSVVTAWIPPRDTQRERERERKKESQTETQTVRWGFCSSHSLQSHPLKLCVKCAHWG